MCKDTVFVDCAPLVAIANAAFMERHIHSGTSHCNNWPDSESAVFASGIRTFDVLRNGKSELAKRRSRSDGASNGKHFHPDVGNLGKPLSEGCHGGQITPCYPICCL